MSLTGHILGNGRLGEPRATLREMRKSVVILMISCWLRSTMGLRSDTGSGVEHRKKAPLPVNPLYRVLIQKWNVHFKKFFEPNQVQIAISNCKCSFPKSPEALKQWKFQRIVCLLND